MSPLTQQEGQDLLEVIEDRHEIKSALITSQLPTKHWHEFIGNPTVADAICDRLVHNAHVIEMKGESVRKLKGTELYSIKANMDHEETKKEGKALTMLDTSI